MKPTTMARVLIETIIIFSLGLVPIGTSSLLLAQTNQYLDAPVVRSEIKIHLNGKTLQWAADNDSTPRAFPSNALFLTRSSVYVTYPLLNPLRVQASASAIAADDPAYAAITKLINGITSVATTVAPAAAPAAPGGGAAPPPLCSSARMDLEALNAELYGVDTSATTMQVKVAAWTTMIDASLNAKSGPEAIAAGVAAIKNDASNIKKDDVDKAKDTLKRIKGCVTDVNTPAAELPAYVAAAGSDFNPRIEQLTALVSSANSLADLLEKQFGDANKWLGQDKKDFVISSEVAPTFAKMQTVTVKVTNVSIKMDLNTAALSTEQDSAGTVTFNVRKYAVLSPEVGVGAVFGSITVPQYGTSTNSSGQTIVARVSSSSVSVNPTVLVNFVCRCNTGLLTPMLQIGAAASKTLPAILVGGGVRLFGLGKGDVALGGGAMFAWYKDLQKLHVGDVVTGTQAIQSDLGFSGAPKIGSYVAIQYKF